MTDRIASDPGPFNESDPSREADEFDEVAEPSVQEIHDELLACRESAKQNYPSPGCDADIMKLGEYDFMFDDSTGDDLEPDEHDDLLDDSPDDSEGEDFAPSEYERLWSPEEIAQATGTTSKALGIELIQKTMAATPVPKGTPRDVVFRKWQANFEMLRDIAPRNATEGMFASLMVRAYNTSMDSQSRADPPGVPPEKRDQELKHGGKFSGSFVQLALTLEKYRGKGHQTITVNRMTAIVGNVSADTRAKPDSAGHAGALSDDSAADALSRESLKPAKPAKQPVARKRTR